MTEQAYFHSVAQQEAFKELDVEEFEVVATLDNLTSEICQEMDGKHFPMKDYEPGVTAPPFHPWCRSVTVPYFDDDFDVGERAARDEDGETYYVPADMTYPEWKQSFVDGETDGLNNIVDRPIIEQSKIIELAKKFADDLLQHPDKIKFDNGEPIENYLNKEIGYDGLPNVVSASEFDMLSEGKQVLYRGITDLNDITAKEMLEQFKYGSFYSGRGVYGNGTYADIDKSVAEYYAYKLGRLGHGDILEMLLMNEAKTVSFRDIYKEWEKLGIYKIPENKREVYQQVIGNVGAYASIKGYDAITFDGWQKKNYVIILNRTKVIVKE